MATVPKGLCLGFECYNLGPVRPLHGGFYIGIHFSTDFGEEQIVPNFQEETMYLAVFSKDICSFWIKI